jgi:hypothetical protein
MYHVDLPYDQTVAGIRCCCGFCSEAAVRRFIEVRPRRTEVLSLPHRRPGRWPPAIACPRPGRRRHPGDLAAVFGDPRGGCRGASDAPGRPQWTARCRGQCAHVGGEATPRPRQQTWGPGLLRPAVHSGRCRAAAEDFQDVLTSGVSPRPATDLVAADPQKLAAAGLWRQRFPAAAGAGLQHWGCASWKFAGGAVAQQFAAPQMTSGVT